MSILRRLLLVTGGGGSFTSMSDLSHIVFDVKAYGATGDGTTDDTTAIGLAIAAACGSGGIVWFPPGDYLITSTLTISCDGVTLAGAGPGASTILADPGMDADTMVEFDTCQYGGIEGLGLSSASGKSDGAGVLLTDCFSMSLEDLKIVNQDDGVHIVDSTIVRITDCNLYNQGGHGIWIDCDAGNDFYLTGIVADNSPAAGGNGIYVSGGDAIILSNCDFLHFANGLVIQPTTGRRSEWHFFTGAIFDNSTNAGIYIGGDAGHIHGVTFANSWSASNGTHGMVIAGGAGDLEGISFTNGKILSNGEHGIFLDTPAEWVTIADSQIVGNSLDSANASDGIKVENGVLHLTITGNQFNNSLGAGGTQGYGVSFVSGATDYVILQGNDMSGNGQGGIENQAGVTGVNLSISGNL